MKLFYSPSSPYARKTRIVAIEKGLHTRIESIATSPFDDTPASRALSAANPLRKIPTLVLDDGTAIYDSHVICEYFDQIGDGPALIPRDADERIRHLTIAAAADGILDAAFSVVMELRRPAENRSEFWIERWMANIGRAMNALSLDLTDQFQLQHITAICAIDYLDFRLADRFSPNSDIREWRSKHVSRHSVAETMPSEVL